MKEIYVNMDCNETVSRFDVSPNNIRIRSVNDEISANSVQVNVIWDMYNILFANVVYVQIQLNNLSSVSSGTLIVDRATVPTWLKVIPMRVEIAPNQSATILFEFDRTQARLRYEL